MLGAVKDKLRDNAKNKIYDKENKQVLIEFRDTVLEDIESTLADALATKAALERVHTEPIYSDQFIVDKLANEEQHLDYCVSKLKQISDKSIKRFKLSDIFKAYKRVLKTYRSIRNIKEYVHRIKEDKLIHDFTENSQCN